MPQRISTQHALCSVLAPPIIPTTKKTTEKRRKEVFLYLKMKEKKTHCRGPGTSGLHQSISLKGGWELASSQWSSRIRMGVQREYRRERIQKRERERERLRLRLRACVGLIVFVSTYIQIWKIGHSVCQADVPVTVSVEGWECGMYWFCRFT